LRDRDLDWADVALVSGMHTLEHLPWSEEASLRKTIPHKTLQMARTGAWLSSSLRVKKEES
jgi:hypothetical protein